MGTSCPICWDDLEGKVKASPNACDHVFCLPCIEKWSKLGSYCPVDRKRYRKIIKLDSEDAIQVKPRKRKRTRIVYDFTTNCDICSKDDNSDTLLLCDCCDLGFHCHCLKPPLTVIPAGLWFCPTCVAVEERLKKNKGITKEVEAEMGINYKSITEKGIENPSSLKCDNAGYSSNKQTTNVVNAFHDIVSVFQGMKFEKELQKSNCKGDNTDDISFYNGDFETSKMFKTFNFTEEAERNLNKSKQKFKDLNANISNHSTEDITCSSKTNVPQNQRNSKNIATSDDGNSSPFLFSSVPETNISRTLNSSRYNSEPSSSYCNKNEENSLNESCQIKKSPRIKQKTNRLSLRERRKSVAYNKNYSEENFDVLYDMQLHCFADTCKSNLNSSLKVSDVPEGNLEGAIQDSAILCSQAAEKPHTLVDAHEKYLPSSRLETSGNTLEGKEENTVANSETKEKLSEAESSLSLKCSQVNEANLSKEVTVKSLAKCAKLRVLKPVVKLERLSILNFLGIDFNNENSGGSKNSDCTRDSYYTVGSDYSRKSSLEDKQPSTNFNCIVLVERINILNFLGINSRKSADINENDLRKECVSDSESSEFYEESDDEYASSEYDSQETAVPENMESEECDRKYTDNIKMKFCTSCSDIIFSSNAYQSLCRICKMSSAVKNQCYSTTLYDVSKRIKQEAYESKECFLFNKPTKFEKQESKSFASTSTQTEISCSTGADRKAILRTFITSEKEIRDNNVNKSFYFSDLKDHLVIRNDGSFYLNLS